MFLLIFTHNSIPIFDFMNLTPITKSFENLSVQELYKLLQLRNEVFIVEQNCVYLDIDNKDQDSFHLFILDDSNLAGYSRILPAGKSYDFVSFGRVVISPEYRGKGLGRIIIDESIKSCRELFGDVNIQIGAQLYLLDLYKSFGFVECSEPYDEDGIMHIDMVKSFI